MDVIGGGVLLSSKLEQSLAIPGALEKDPEAKLSRRRQQNDSIKRLIYVR